MTHRFSPSVILLDHSALLRYLTRIFIYPYTSPLRGEPSSTASCRLGQIGVQTCPVHYCTDFTSTATATVSTYGKNLRQRRTFLYAVRVLQGSHPLNIHPYHLSTRATLSNQHSLADK
ncbi:hypothetical protein RF11_12378 [Thelohanellus kitauei]|uniref:Uncharacterized protein n=1 Tax=Thelohanellus kitauei TaxID=669202 RepID=A0A0C2J4Z6_THEKT|nr:hypothetical protein RF11_12378 [Thelohanellus kitauei]